jgi:hypothetical protein
MQNKTNQQFQLCLESQVIEVMKMKMLPIQFVSNVIDESDLHHTKQREPRIWTIERITIH